MSVSHKRVIQKNIHWQISCLDMPHAIIRCKFRHSIKKGLTSTSSFCFFLNCCRVRPLSWKLRWCCFCVYPFYLLIYTTTSAPFLHIIQLPIVCWSYSFLYYRVFIGLTQSYYSKLVLLDLKRTQFLTEFCCAFIIMYVKLTSQYVINTVVHIKQNTEVGQIKRDSIKKMLNSM